MRIKHTHSYPDFSYHRADIIFDYRKKLETFEKLISEQNNGILTFPIKRLV